MIVKRKPVNAKVNLSRQNGAIVTTRRYVEGDHCVNISVLGNLWAEVRGMN
jgi:hypothetical protein